MTELFRKAYRWLPGPEFGVFRYYIKELPKKTVKVATIKAPFIKLRVLQQCTTSLVQEEV